MATKKSAGGGAKKALSKSGLITAIAEQHGEELTRKQVKNVIESLIDIGHRELKKAGIFTLPGFAKFRVVKRQLLAGAEGLARSILVCSARPDEGKTFCAINLALSLAAERDTEVLLVDADVAKPDVCRRLGLICLGLSFFGACRSRLIFLARLLRHGLLALLQLMSHCQQPVPHIASLEAKPDLHLFIVLRTSSRKIKFNKLKSFIYVQILA